MARPIKPIDPTTQAGRIIRRFGGLEQLRYAMAKTATFPPHAATIYRWLKAGNIPHQWTAAVEDAAAAAGVKLTPLDFDPRSL